MTNKINLAFTLFLLLLIGIGCKDLPVNNTNQPLTPPPAPSAPLSANSQPSNKKPVTAPPAEKPAASISWSDYERVYSTKSNATDIQRDALWKEFEGKSVNWSGTVTDVSKGMFGGMKLNIKMNEETLTYDISIDLKEDQTDKAMALTKGKKINFTGKLKSPGGAVLPLSIEEGEIK